MGQRDAVQRSSRSPADGASTLLPRALVALLCLSAFGPYLVGSLRVEHIVVYGLAAVVVPFAFPFIRSIVLRLVLPWALFVAISLVAVVSPVTASLPWDRGSLMASADNLLLPVAILLTLACLVRPSTATTALNTAGAVIVWGAAVNAVLSIIQSMTPALNPLLRYFWSSSPESLSTAEHAATMGRYSGIFNQPAEAGLVYSLALFLAIYLYRKRTTVLLFVILVLCIGGAFTVSKVFVLAGLPLGVYYLWRSVAPSRKIWLLLIVPVTAALLTSSGFFQNWDGFDYLIRLLTPPADQSLLEFYTAGRWNEDSAIMMVMSAVLSASPWVGVGLAGLAVPYDSAWTEAIIVAGLLGVVCVAATYLAILWIARHTQDPQRRRLAFMVAIMLIGASFGIPSLTVNRSTTLIWVVVTLLILAVGAERSGDSDYAGTLAGRPGSPWQLTVDRRRRPPLPEAGSTVPAPDPVSGSPSRTSRSPG
ncbi:hypothetical protein [Citricoccus sp. NR2]|uniref:hypothetical protein n=1 Tax=Citricoccus sp. NR2 TaxID=3004095 RepID=UPI0022DDEA2B|nr:hypothetical protein [Citricoccus sp. NR2]WBL19228.1 hypothetical protein O1A05_00525 [Citricoccus sp. NR2]